MNELTIQEPPMVETKKDNQKQVLNANPYQIVVIDDNPMIQKMITRAYQEDENFRVTTFDCGEDYFLEKSTSPDIIILDFHLSDDESLMNGLEILNKIEEQMPETKVIMLSSQAEVNTAVNCLKKGATDYVVKDDVMSINVKKSVEQIVKSIELKQEIQLLSQTIKRDKLLIKGYGIVIFALVILAAVLYFV